MSRTAETEDLMQLRLLNLELLRQLWVGQEAVRQAVTTAAAESRLDPGSSYDSEMPLSPEASSAASGAPRSRDECRVPALPATRRGDARDVARLGRASSRVASTPSAKRQHPESLGQPRPPSPPLPATADLKELASSAGPRGLRPHVAWPPRPSLARQSKPPKPRVTTCPESAVPESSWRFRPYLGYDWIAGSLDSNSPITSASEAFFSTLQKFREANREDCVHGYPTAQSPGLRESDVLEEDHQCVYCYRVSRRLFLEPMDPGAPCRLCGTPRDQRGPETLLEPAQVRVSIPLSSLDPPHRYRIHRRQSFDASDTLALPRHCLLGWDILPPKPERSSAPRSLDLWSWVSSEAQPRTLLAASASRLALPVRTPVWSEPQSPQSHAPQPQP